MDTLPAPRPSSSSPPVNFLSLGADLVSQVQHLVGTEKVRALHVKFGGRTIKEVPVGPLTAAATVALVALAVIVSTLSIEVEHEPKGVNGSAKDEAAL